MTNKKIIICVVSLALYTTLVDLARESVEGSLFNKQQDLESSIAELKASIMPSAFKGVDKVHKNGRIVP